jgi:hypothetical protein
LVWSSNGIVDAPFLFPAGLVSVVRSNGEDGLSTL